MKELAAWWKAHKSDLLSLVLWMPLWVFTGYDFVMHLDAMGLVRGLTMGMIFFLVAPVTIWRAIDRLRTETR